MIIGSRPTPECGLQLLKRARHLFGSLLPVKQQALHTGSYNRC